MAFRLRRFAKTGSPSAVNLRVAQQRNAAPVVESRTYPTPPTLWETVTDDFNRGSLGPDWDTNSTATISGNRLAVVCQNGWHAAWTPANGWATPTGDPRTIRGSSVYAEITPPDGYGTGSMWVYVEVIHSRTDSHFSMFLEGANLQTRVVVDGVGVHTLSPGPVYSPTAHRFWRFREFGGTVYFDVSADAGTWTNIDSWVHGWGARLDEVLFQAGSGHNGSIPDSTLYVDNLNLVPPVTVIAPSAAATVTANAPTLITGAVAVPPAAAVTATAVAPAVRGGATVIAPAATGAVAALAPTLTAGATVTGTAATISAAAVAPTVSSGATTIAVVATLTVAATAPAVLGGAKVGATVATVTVTAVAPAVTASSGSAVVALAATVTVAASIPTVTAVRTATVVAPAATILADAAAPTVAAIRAATVLAVQALVDVAALAPAVTAAGVTSVGQMERATAPTATVNGAPVPTATVTAQRPAEPVLAGATATAATISGTATATATLERS